jgi:hypothetical protein
MPSNECGNEALNSVTSTDFLTKSRNIIFSRLPCSQLISIKFTWNKIQLPVLPRKNS